jgi:hypothetical protein
MRPSTRAKQDVSAFCRAAFACACLVLVPATARAEFQIEGGVTDVRLEATQAPMEEVFSALSAVYGVEITATSVPDQTVTGIYSGPLQRVISQLLGRYDFVLSVSPEKIDIAFLGVRAGGAQLKVAQGGRFRVPAAGAK